MNIRIKICGVAHVDDAKAAVDAGADLVGLNFVPESPRCLDLATAEAISRAVDGETERVGVFRDAQPEEIERVLRRVNLERVQFHLRPQHVGIGRLIHAVARARHALDVLHDLEVLPRDGHGAPQPGQFVPRAVSFRCGMENPDCALFCDSTDLLCQRVRPSRRAVLIIHHPEFLARILKREPQHRFQEIIAVGAPFLAEGMKVTRMAVTEQAVPRADDPS